VLAKKPDLKYRDFSSSDLPEIQLSILCESSKYLKVGGVLIYSTCTLRKEENECVVSAFLDSHSDYSSLDFNVGEYKSQDGMFTFIPHVHKTDGFFIALIRRNK